MIRHKLFGRLTFVLAALTVLTFGGQAFAATQQQNGGGNGLRVSPVRTELTIKPGETKVVDVMVSNVTSSPASLQTIVNDFTASSNETGEPAILLNPKQYAPSHSLKRYVAAIPDFVLQPGKEKTVKVKITIPADAAGGGYFGAVRFKPVSSGGDKNVTLSGSVGSLILVKVPGDIKEQLSIASFDVRKDDSPKIVSFDNKSLNGTVRFKNEGNVQEQPFGKIVLKKGSKTLGTYEINNTSPRGNVLPDSIRKFSVPLKNVGSFGKYTLEGNFGYGANGQLLSAKTSFYVVPLWLVIVIAVAILAALFAIFRLARNRQPVTKRVTRKGKK